MERNSSNYRLFFFVKWLAKSNYSENREVYYGQKEISKSVIPVNGIGRETKEKICTINRSGNLGRWAGIIPYFAVARMLITLIGSTKEISFFAAYCLMAAAGYLLKVLFSIWSTSVSHTATFEVLKEIRKKLLSKLSRLPMGVILDTPSGRLKDTIVDRVLLTKSFLEIKIITVLYSTVI